MYLGESLGFYSKFWWWDLFLHGIFGIYGVIVALSIMEGIITKKKEVSKNRFNKLTAILAFNFTITLSTLWEMFEFLSDYFFNTSMADGGLEDTATDLLIKILFAIITSIIYYYRKRKVGNITKVHS